MVYDLTAVKILVVDDIQPMVKLTSSVLQTLGFSNVITANNGEDAYEMVVKHDPHLIITDWMMQPCDGLEFTKILRSSASTPNRYVPVIMMTGYSSQLRVENARDQGITEFLTKPFTAKDLYNRIFQVIEKPRQFVDGGQYFGPDRRRRKKEYYTGPTRRYDDDIKIKEEPEQTVTRNILKELREKARGSKS